MNTLFVGQSRPLINFCQAHSHQCWEIVIPISGTGYVEAEGQVVEFCEESLYIVPPNISHSTASETYFSDVYIHVSTLPFSAKKITAVYGIKNLNALGELIHSLYLTENADTINSALEFIVKMAADILKEPYHSSPAYNIKKYLSENISVPKLTMQTLSAEFQYDADYLRKIFKQEFGITPMKYLEAARVKKAKELFKKMPAYNVTQVSLICGFCDPLYFSRVFKKYTNRSPKQYKDYFKTV